nr:carcinoembryonic antigen-related cell adhesion molecule 16-like [Pogona vitticeps]
MSRSLPSPKAAKSSWRSSPNWWPMLLLAAFIFSCTCVTRSHAAKEATIEIMTEPSQLLVGMDVNLLLRATRQEIKSCVWFRGHRLKQFAILTYRPPNETIHNESYTGRETVQKDCSLYIKNLTLDDNDFYSVKRVLQDGLTEFGTTPLLIREVLESPEPRQALSPGVTFGVVAGCLMGLMFITGMFVFRAAGR